MTSVSSVRVSLLSLCLLVVVLLASCTKEEHDCPKDKHEDNTAATGTTKGAILVNSTDGDVQNGGCAGPRVDGSSDGISDDGDDVGDGERNRKRRAN